MKLLATFSCTEAYLAVCNWVKERHKRGQIAQSSKDALLRKAENLRMANQLEELQKMLEKQRKKCQQPNGGGAVSDCLITEQLNPTQP